MRHHQFVIEWRARAPAAKSRRRATEGTGHQDGVTGLRAASQDGSATRTLAEHRDRDCDVVGLSEVAAHYGTTRHRRGVGDTSVKFFQVRSRRRAHRDDRTPRAPTYRRQVRNRGGDRLETEVFEGEQRPIEVHAQHRYVGADECFAHERSQNGRVVADMTFSLRNRVTAHDGDDTLKYVILMPGVLSYES